MKKTISLLLALVLCLSLCACGNNNSSLIEEYENRIAALEGLLAERDAEINRLVEEVNRLLAESDVVEPEGTEPQNTEPQYETVEITLDNWQDYFELKEYNEFHKNGFGEFTWLWSQYILTTKDGIVCDKDKCSITIERSFTYGNAPYTIDVENETITYGEVTDIEETKSAAVDMRSLDQWISGAYDKYGTRLIAEEIHDIQGNVRVVVDVNVVRITGILYFYREN